MWHAASDQDEILPNKLRAISIFQTTVYTKNANFCGFSQRQKAINFFSNSAP